MACTAPRFPKPLVVRRVAWVWTVHHKEDGKSDGLDEGVESGEKRSSGGGV